MPRVDTIPTSSRKVILSTAPWVKFLLTHKELPSICQMRLTLFSLITSAQACYSHWKASTKTSSRQQCLLLFAQMPPAIHATSLCKTTVLPKLANSTISVFCNFKFKVFLLPFRIMYFVMTLYRLTLLNGALSLLWSSVWHLSSWLLSIPKHGQWEEQALNLTIGWLLPSGS